MATADQRDLQQLVRALRAGAPNAVIGFVLWPSQRQLAHDRAAEQMVRRMAALEGFDAISASTLLDEAARNGEPSSSFYADPVHPNIDGHAMLAGLACAWLLGNLVPAASRCASDGAALAAPAAKPPPSSPPTYEQCYSRADAMPVLQSQAAGWRLLDEGGAKGVVKMGYVSTRVGEVLQLGPILPEARCGLFDVSLGYLLSWRRAQGALHVSCTGGCSCMPMYQYRWQKQRDHEPFPLLQTWTYARGTNVDPALANASTTAYGRFLLVKTMDEASSSSCTIRVEHMRSEPSAGAEAPSRVRVDGLSLKLSSCATHCIAMRHASGSVNRTRLDALRMQCASGKKEGRAGFLAPACVGCAEARGEV